MTDQEPEPFTIVDRRVASQRIENEVKTESSNQNSPLPAEEVHAEVPMESANAESAETKPDPISELEGPDFQDTAAAEVDNTGLPNPAFYLSMAAMHIGTTELFKALLPIFDAHAWQNLGLIANQVSGEANKDLPAAQLAIDAVQFLLGKVESSLSATERRDLQRRLNDLRMNYLAKLREG